MDESNGLKLKIVETAIESLRSEGLRFSVDTLAARLKISKKTVYKHFPDKEALAYAVYETYYAAATAQIAQIAAGGDARLRLLLLYCDAGRMICREIFNKYKLNDSVYAYAAERHEALWGEILPRLAPAASPADAAVFRAIVDGAFEKSAVYGASMERTAEILTRVL